MIGFFYQFFFSLVDNILNYTTWIIIILLKIACSASKQCHWSVVAFDITELHYLNFKLVSLLWVDNTFIKVQCGKDNSKVHLL